VALTIRGESSDCVVGSTSHQFDGADDPSLEPDGSVQRQRDLRPRFRARIGLACGMDENQSASRGSPAADFNRFAAIDHEGRPWLLQG
jgi:hypothetical protein